MIQSKEDYIAYQEADRIALNVRNNFIDRFFNDVWQFQRLLRKYEFYLNCKKSIVYVPYLLYLRHKFHSLSVKLGFTVPPNVFGPGLRIAHIGTIVVNEQCRVGSNCRIHNCVHIATQAHPRGEPDRCPKIGNNVFIGPGSVIVGDIEIADNIAIGANSYVDRSFSEPGITIAGAPAKKVSDKGSERF